MSEAFVELNIQSVVKFFEHYSGLLQVVASFIMAYISYRMYRNAIKVSEKPAVVELSQFFIAPLERYLQDLREKECEKFSPMNCFRLLEAKLSAHGYYTYISLLPSNEILLAEFYSILDRTKKRRTWDLRVKELDGLCERLTLRINALKERLKELIEEHRDEIKEKYETIDWLKKSYPTFQDLINSMVNEFYECYIRRKKDQSMGNLSWYYFDDLFNRIKGELSYDLEEIDDIRRRRNDTIENLISLLRDVRDHLKNEYKLTPSEQSLRILSDYY
ncbi:MAG: hypothetical protein DSO07_07715 [Thermoproteota archaeon]|jgi:uncharacterized coiled-coil DUF342 family protein|uniref:Uncharacterized protein n=1 Tax=Candidatus Methanodesulfokora washburnensis TaxID=2478471 RepID=A0A520KJT8_9CREN|nr:MAG: hypothetical protein EF810_05070 [Candidatus Methanodesulfokores washburnensis]TDA40840.1 MAG: hypothetical protein DSO07_07715 [Candidatus Korarchaeota archaeon]